MIRSSHLLSDPDIPKQLHAYDGSLLDADLVNLKYKCDLNYEKFVNSKKMGTSPDLQMVFVKHSDRLKDQDVQTWTKNRIRNAICSLANDISILNNTEGEREKQFYEKNFKNSKKAELIQYLDSIKDLKETLNVNHIDIEFSQE